MRWRDREESSNVEVRGGGLGRMGIALGGGGGLLLLAVSLLFGVDLTPNLTPSAPVAERVEPGNDELAHFTKVVLRDTEVVWGEEFARRGRRYREPTLVLFSQSVRSACGFASTAVGPFYCPPDERVYIDLAFYRDMERKLRAGGDFARAYVIAHEVGHHVQNQLGYMRYVDLARRSGSRDVANATSVKLELQADFLAGVWANRAQSKFRFLEAGDIDEALNAAFQVGDDRLQQRTRGVVVPDSFTHGTSAERQAAFREGFATGSLEAAAKYFADPYPGLAR